MAASFADATTADATGFSIIVILARDATHYVDFFVIGGIHSPTSRSDDIMDARSRVVVVVVATVEDEVWR